jgi:hypothetical protein
MPNWIAYGALVAWPIVTIALFQLLPARKAVIWGILGAYLILPVGTAFDFPGVPALDKTTIPSISVLVCALLFARQRAVALPREWFLVLLLLIFILSPVLTAMNNRDPLILSASAIPGMNWYDALSVSAGQAIRILPFLLGYTLLSREADHRAILMALVLGAIAYAPLMAFELRMSPQLHRILYGYFPHEFIQQIRDGGFRPVVFLGHGLTVAIYITMAALAALGLWRQRARISGFSTGPIAAGLFVLLILCKSLGALIIGVALGALLLTLKNRRIVSICSLIALVIVLYPEVRGVGLVPTGAVSELASSISTDRADSLNTRLENEDQLLDKANERPVFGWGSWGRNQIYQAAWQGDVVTSITDGTWIIVIGTYGWLGYIACFGLLCFPFWRAFRVRKEMAVTAPTVALLAVLLANLLDLIPNSSLSPLTWLIAGALSAVRVPRRTGRRTETAEAAQPRETALTT